MAEPLKRLRRAWAPGGPLLVAILLALAYVGLLGTLSLRRHQNLGTNALDLGYTDQAVWNTLHGRPFRFSTYLDAAFQLDIPIQAFDQPDVLLGYHVEPILAAIAPLYLLHDGPETLLWLQTVGIALGAVLVYLIARHRLALPHIPDIERQVRPSPLVDTPVRHWLPIGFVLIYLLSPPLQAANLSDFHAVALTPTLLLAAFFFLETGRSWGFVLSCLLAMMCKEEIGLLVAALGLWAAFGRRRWALGLGVAVVGAGWSLLCFASIMPHYSGLSGSAFLVRYGQFGDSLSAILGNLVRQPGLFVSWLLRAEVLRYLRDLWLSSGGLAILYPPAVAMALPSLAVNAFANSDWMHSGGAHYSAAIVPFLVISAIYGVDRAAGAVARRIGRLGGEHERRAAGAAGPQGATWLGAYERTALILVGLGLAVALANHYERGVLPLSRRFVLEPAGEHARRAQPFIEQVNRLPPQVPISVGSNLYPHVSHRQRVYLFPTVSDAQVILLDVSGPPAPIGWEEQVQTVQQLLEYNRFGVAAADDGILLLARGLGAYEWPTQFYDVFLAEDSTPAYRVGADMGSHLRLEGFDWEIQPVVTPKPLIQVTTYWRVLAPLDEGCRLVFYYLDDLDRVVGIRPEELAASWYPLWMWAPGQVVQATLPPAPLGDVQHLGAALLLPGADPANTGGRVAPITSAYGLALTLWQHGTIVELVRR